MTDTFGAQAIPSTAQTATALTDPALSVFGAFLTAVVNADVAGAWGAFAAGLPVRNVFTHNPEDVDFTVRDTPALFLWRTQSKSRTAADSYLTIDSTINALWVQTQHADQKRRAQWAPFLAGLSASMSRALWFGRHPAWIASGDTDTQARVKGSSLVRMAGLMSRVIDITTKPEKLTIAIDGGEPARYTGVLVTFPIRELLHVDVAARPGISPSRLDATINETVTIRATGGFSSGFDAGFDAESSGRQTSSGFSPGIG